MATFKTLAEAYAHAEENFLEPRVLRAIEYGKLVDLLRAYGFTDAQVTVAVYNVWETEVDDDHTSALYVLHQRDDGFEWACAAYVEYGPNCADGGEINI